MLAKDVNDNALIQAIPFACYAFASKLAPTRSKQSASLTQFFACNACNLAITPAAVCSPINCSRTLPLSSTM